MIIVNKCEAIYDETELKQAIIWHIGDRGSWGSYKRLTIFMYGSYPAVRLFGRKAHIHRLIAAWSYRERIRGQKYVHHINHNKKDRKRWQH